MMLALTVLAFTLLAAAPALADVSTTAILNQVNQGDVVAFNDATQTADQRQFAPGGDAQFNVDEDGNGDEVTFVFGTDETFVFGTDENGFPPGRAVGLRRNNDGDSFPPGRAVGLRNDDVDFIIMLEGDDETEVDVDQTGGAGGTQDITQRQNQDAVATGATFDATQLLY